MDAKRKDKGPGAKVTKRKRDAAEEESETKRARSDKKREAASRDGNALSALSKSSPNECVDTQSGRTLVEPLKRPDLGETGWKVSKPMGGRMLDIDPILTHDEQYLIITYNTSIQVYSTADSLLVRRIPISLRAVSAPTSTKSATIVATRLSKKNPNFVWVARSDGQICRVDWTKSSFPHESFQTGSRTAKAVAVVSLKGSKLSDDVLAVVESGKDLELVLYQPRRKRSPVSVPVFSMKRPGDGLHLLEAADDGYCLVGAVGDTVFLGYASGERFENLSQVQYRFWSFGTPDIVTALDVRTRPPPRSKSQNMQSHHTVDLLLGGARGAIYFYEDAFAESFEKLASPKLDVQARKFHWHRKAVHAVKWSRDGNYIISGGSENVLVLWQMDTSKTDFLPHLSGSVENVVVSASGSSYVLHLDDNSTMILSTAEMKPTAYVSGIQSAFANPSTPKDLLVKRVWDVSEHVLQPIPAAIRPGQPAQLHVCVGSGRQATMSGNCMSTPLLQSFDLESFSSISKQALARTQPTDVNISNKGFPIDEPLVTHIAFSADGSWLASVDDWAPAARDVQNVSSDLRDQFIQERHETYLKFWEVRDGAESLALLSRINNPHGSGSLQSILDLTTNPAATAFATLGCDGMLRVWRPKLRQTDGIVSKGAKGRDAHSWGCSKLVAVGVSPHQGAVIDIAEASLSPNPQGSLSWSEDGSTIFAAYGAAGAGAVYVINAASGEVVKTLENMWTGSLRSLRVLSPFVIALSKELRVYDTVSDELRYGIEVPEPPRGLPLVQLVVDRTSNKFAIALPMDDVSSIAVFDPEDPQPLLIHITPQRIVSLVSAPDAGGFVALDDAAQVSLISEGVNSSSLAAAQPLQDIGLDLVDHAASSAPGGTDVDAVDAIGPQSGGEEEEDESAAVGEDEDVGMDEDFHAGAVTQQRLAGVFDAAAAYGGSSVEDMFYKVTSLLATTPLPTA